MENQVRPEVALMQPYLIVLLRRIFLYRFGGHIPQPLSEMLSILGNRRCVRIGSVPENRETSGTSARADRSGKVKDPVDRSSRLRTNPDPGHDNDSTGTGSIRHRLQQAAEKPLGVGMG